MFDNGVTQHFATHTEHERDVWLEAIQINSYTHVHSTLLSLQGQLELKQAHSPDSDTQTQRIHEGPHIFGTIS